MTHKTIVVSILLLIGCGAQALAKDGFEKVSCNADIAKALLRGWCVAGIPAPDAPLSSRRG